MIKFLKNHKVFVESLIYNHITVIPATRIINYSYFVIGFRGVVYYIVFNIIGGLFAFTILNRDFNQHIRFLGLSLFWQFLLLELSFMLCLDELK